MNPSQKNNDNQNIGKKPQNSQGGTNQSAGADGQLSQAASKQLPKAGGDRIVGNIIRPDKPAAKRQPTAPKQTAPQQIPKQPPPPKQTAPQQIHPTQPPPKQTPQPQPSSQPAVSTAPAGKKKPAAQKGNPNSTQNNLEIAEIRDGIVIMNDGSFRSVVMVKSINFDLMSPAEREGIEMGFQNFLNSLYFPIQIFIRSQKVDIGPYIQKLDKIRAEHDNMLLALLMDDYLAYIDQLAAQTNIMDKHFYVVVPFFPREESTKPLSSSKGLLGGVMNMFSSAPTHLVINEKDLADAKTELKNRVQAVLSGLMECGVQGLPLDTQELIELYYGSYNPDTATRQELKNFNDVNTPVVTKGRGQARQPNLERELS